LGTTGTPGSFRAYADMSFERVLLWMAIIGVVGFALTLVWMLASR